MLETGSVLATRFRILRALTGYGEVYAAEDLQLGATVALRRMPPLDDAVRREVQLARRLTHPNIVRVFDLVTDSGVEYLSMEVVEGETLAARLAREGRLPGATARDIGVQIARAMDAVRKAGIVHGTLTADCVVLMPRSDGGVRAVLTGFAWTGSGEQDGAALDGVLQQLGVRREELPLEPVYRARPTRRLMVGVAGACAVVLAVVANYREELFAPPLPESVVRWYRDGETAIADGAYAKAEALFSQALRESPEYVAARCRLAEALQESDRRDRAREELMKALEGRTRGRADRLLREATRYYLVGDAAKGIAAARKRASAMGDSMSAGDVARMLERSGQLEEARAEYAQLMQRYPGQPGPMLQYARLLASNKQEKDAARWVDEAERLYRALQNTEGVAAVELERGRLTQHVENSVAHARNAASLAESAGSHALVIRAKLLEASRYAGKGDLPQSEQMARLAVSLAEENHLGAVAAEGLIDLAEVIFAQVKYEEAARLLEQARGIAQRFSAKRTEAEVLIRLGRVLARINDTERRRQAHAALDEAEKFFQLSGAKASLVRTLRTRGDVYRFEGKLGEAQRQHERAARESETDHDRTLSRIALAQVSMLQGNYLAVAKLQRENADYYRRAGNKLLAQRYQLDHAHALRLGGRWEEAESALRVVVDEGPGPEFVERCEVDQAAIDFGRRRLDSALGRLEQNLAKIDPKAKKALYERRRYDLCMKYASAGWTGKAEKLCTEIAPVERPSPRRYLDVLDALAMVSLQKHDYPRAVRLARESLELSAAHKMTESHFFTLMLLTRALHGAGDAEWRSARDRTREALRQWEQESGEEVVRQSMTRWFIAEHWNAVQQFE